MDILRTYFDTSLPTMIKTPTRCVDNVDFESRYQNNNIYSSVHVQNTTDNITTKQHSSVKLLTEQIPEIEKYFTVCKKIGEGTFSNVCLATSNVLNNKTKFAIKHLFPTSHPSRILQELKCLQNIGGCSNVVGLLGCYRNQGAVAFIMPYFSHDLFSDYILDMTIEETKMYMKNLLIALQRVHSFNIIHRDVKPNNFLYNRKECRFLLVDFGLSHSVDDCQKHDQDKNRHGKKRRLDSSEKNLVCNESKRPALYSLSTNIQDKNESHELKKPKSGQKRNSPLYKENSPLSKEIIPTSDIRHVKRNLQFGNFTTDMRSEIILPNETPKNITTKISPSVSISSMNFYSSKPELSNFHFSLKKEGSSFLRLQNSQIKSRYSISGRVIKNDLSSSQLYSLRSKNCECEGKPKICNICIVRKPLHAPRAGTPGYRPPEVLLKYLHQTTAVDIWSAGIIMLSIMSQSHPFFRAPDDITALMEIITIFGTDAVKAVAKTLGRNLITNNDCKPLDLRVLCETLCQRKHNKGNTNCDDYQSTSSDKDCTCSANKVADDLVIANNKKYPESAYDLLEKLLCVDPHARCSAIEALQHPFLNES